MLLAPKGREGYQSPVAEATGRRCIFNAEGKIKPVSDFPLAKSAAGV
jgi:hypothetical protein